MHSLVSRSGTPWLLYYVNQSHVLLVLTVLQWGYLPVHTQCNLDFPYHTPGLGHNLSTANLYITILDCFLHANDNEIITNQHTMITYKLS